MSTTPAHLRHLITDSQVVFSPYDPSCLHDDYYTLHLDNWFRYYDKDYDFELGSTTTEEVGETETSITKKNGYYIEPYRMAWTYLKETIYSPNYELIVMTSDEYAKYGLIITNYLFDGNRMRIDFMTNRSVRFYPGAPICKARISETDSSTMAVPIGGIIGWSGSRIPYGYTLCDGSNGSPNLSGNFIMASTSTSYAGPMLAGDPLGYTVYKLAFIMRYK